MEFFLAICAFLTPLFLALSTLTARDLRQQNRKGCSSECQTNVVRTGSVAAGSLAEGLLGRGAVTVVAKVKLAAVHCLCREIEFKWVRNHLLGKNLCVCSISASSQFGFRGDFWHRV